MEQQLKPCSFCGRNDLIVWESNFGKYITCRFCQACGPTSEMDTPEELWNIRINKGK